VYGCSWGQDVPETDVRGDSINVLVIHGTIGDRPLFPGHKLIDPRTFAKEHQEYDLILCGDYHYPFEYKVGLNTTIVNPGVLCRKSIAEKEITPSVVIYNTLTRDTQWIGLGYEHDVWKEKRELSDAPVHLSGDLISMIEDQGEITLSFESSVRSALDKADLCSEAKKVVVDILNKCKEK
jgi:hypothetical protein